MLRFSFDLDKEAEAVENAVKKVLAGGYRTADIMAEGMKQTGTKEMGRPDLQSDRIRTVDQIRGLLERRGLGFSFPVAFLYGIWLWCRRHGKTNNQNNSIQ